MNYKVLHCSRPTVLSYQPSLSHNRARTEMVTRWNGSCATDGNWIANISSHLTFGGFNILEKDSTIKGLIGERKAQFKPSSSPAQAQFNRARGTFGTQMAQKWQSKSQRAEKKHQSSAPLVLKFSWKFRLCNNNMALSPSINATSSWRSWACYCSQLTHFSPFSLRPFPLVCIVTIPPTHGLRAGFQFVRPLALQNPPQNVQSPF